MKRKLYFSFSILLVHNTLPTLSVSVIKASLSIRILWEVVVFPLHVSSQRTNGPWSPRSEKERKRHAATETCGAWDHVSFFLLHWILLCCCSLLTHSLTRPHSALPHPSSPDSNPTLWALCALSLPLLRASPSAGSTRSTSGLIPTVPHCLWLFQTVVTVHYESWWLFLTRFLTFTQTLLPPLIKSCRPCSNF